MNELDGDLSEVIAQNPAFAATFGKARSTFRLARNSPEYAARESLFKQALKVQGAGFDRGTVLRLLASEIHKQQAGKVTPPATKPSVSKPDSSRETNGRFAGSGESRNGTQPKRQLTRQEMDKIKMDRAVREAQRVLKGG